MVREVGHAVKHKQRVHAWQNRPESGIKCSKVYIIIIMGHL